MYTKLARLLAHLPGDKLDDFIQVAALLFGEIMGLGKLLMAQGSLQQIFRGDLKLQAEDYQGFKAGCPGAALDVPQEGGGNAQLLSKPLLGNPPILAQIVDLAAHILIIRGNQLLFPYFRSV